uniref:Uncharacterized protein n=1 Tax=Rhizophora mucronata TaxID=61149 RepID=A0A2P2JV82_RHIMU
MPQALRFPLLQMWKFRALSCKQESLLGQIQSLRKSLLIFRVLCMVISVEHAKKSLHSETSLSLSLFV